MPIFRSPNTTSYKNPPTGFTMPPATGSFPVVYDFLYEGSSLFHWSPQANEIGRTAVWEAWGSGADGDEVSGQGGGGGGYAKTTTAVIAGVHEVYVDSGNAGSESYISVAASDIVSAGSANGTIPGSQDVADSGASGGNGGDGAPPQSDITAISGGGGGGGGGPNGDGGNGTDGVNVMVGGDGGTGGSAGVLDGGGDGGPGANFQNGGTDGASPGGGGGGNNPGSPITLGGGGIGLGAPGYCRITIN